MEVTALQREIMDAERLAERGKIILNLNQQLLELGAEFDKLKVEYDKLREQVESKENCDVN